MRKRLMGVTMSAAAIGGSLLLLAEAAPPTADAASFARTETVANDELHTVWTPSGGMSDQARSTLKRSPLARAALRLYEPFETGDMSVYDHLLAEDFVDVPLAPGQGPGREGMKDHVRDDIVATFADLKMRVEAIHVAGRVVTVRTIISGTQVRPFLGVPATHKLLRYRAVDVHQFNQHRQIARTDHLEDFFTAYRQMTKSSSS